MCYDSASWWTEIVCCLSLLILGTTLTLASMLEQEKLSVRQAWRLTRHYLNGIQKRRERAECGQNDGFLSQYVPFLDVYLGRDDVAQARFDSSLTISKLWNWANVAWHASVWNNCCWYQNASKLSLLPWTTHLESISYMCRNRGNYAWRGSIQSVTALPANCISYFPIREMATNFTSSPKYRQSRRNYWYRGAATDLCFLGNNSQDAAKYVQQFKRFFVQFAKMYPCPYCRHHLNAYVIPNREIDMYPLEYILFARKEGTSSLTVSIADKLDAVRDPKQLRLFLWKLHNTVWSNGHQLVSLSEFELALSYMSSG